MSDSPAPYESYDDPERLLRRFVIRRTGEMSRVAGWLGRLLDLPRRVMDAARRAEAVAATERALAWAAALRRWMITINRAQKEEFLRPDFAPAPAGSLTVAGRRAPDGDGSECGTSDRDGSARERAPRVPPAGFVPMEVAEMWAALEQPFVAPALMERIVASVQARVVTLTREIDADRHRARAACAAVRTPEEDAAALGVEELPFGESLTRICDDLIAAATALGEADVVTAVRAVAADLECRWLAIEAARAARAARAKAAKAAARTAQAAVAASVAAVLGPQGLLAPLPAAMRLAGFPLDVPPRPTPRERVSLRTALNGSTAVRCPVLEIA